MAIPALMIWLWAAAAIAAGEVPSRIEIVSPERRGLVEESGEGLFPDILRAAFEPAGVKVRLDVAPAKRARHQVEAGEADALLALECAGGEGVWSRRPLYVDPVAAVFRPERIDRWRGMETLGGKSAVWLRGRGYQRYLFKQRIRLIWHAVNSRDQGWAMVRRNRVDFYLDSHARLLAYMAANGIDPDDYRVETLWNSRIRLFFPDSERSRKFAVLFDRRMAGLLGSGELARLFEKWGVPFDPKAYGSRE